MESRLATALSLFLLFSFTTAVSARASEPALRQFGEASDPSRATLRVQAGERSAYPIPRNLTGKFAEHLGWNIYNGMDAQILRNPTFADYPFATGQMTPDGVAEFHWERDKINAELRRQATRFGWPDAELDGLVQARADGLACFWTRSTIPHFVQVSPDTGPHGGRAQRFRVNASGEGIAQWIYLPLHRVRTFEFEILVRSPNATSLIVFLDLPGGHEKGGVDRAEVTGVSTQWRVFTGRLVVGAGLPVEAAYKFSILGHKPDAEFVIAHVFLRPADHVNGADPDVVRLLKESHLPLLRWPGGNFVSGYHWEDGVGPVERRPTKPNYAWGGVEPNTFGTDEFIAFCHAVGCEPMICVNAGSGTPEEAARWIEYCNGSPRTPMGARRAANGHPKRYHVRYWEVGNELWGRWQFAWTTAAGYVDRYAAFASAMRAADPGIELLACGAPVFWGKPWNDTLIAGAAPLLGAVTDHPLIGGDVAATVDPLAVYRDFMAVPEVLETKWAALRDDMTKAGVKEPRLAVTELQMFAHLRRAGDDASARLTRDNLVSPGTLAEALYDVLIYHAAVRLAPFVEMVTHSAIVNHGGGLRKERERVYANPCYYAQSAFAELAGATPVVTEIAAAREHAPRVLPDLKNATPEAPFSAADTLATVRVVDALAALANDNTLLLSIVHRGTAGPIHLTVQLADFQPGATAAVRTLCAAVPWAANSLEKPDAVQPVDSTVAVRDGKLELDLLPYSVLRVRVPKAP